MTSEHRIAASAAIVLAIALAYGAQAIVHADQDWMKKAASYRQAIRLVYLGDHCP